MVKRIEGAVELPEAVEIFVDGKPIPAYPGESLAAALLAAGIVRLRYSPRAGTPRGAFCLMGVCQECVVQVDGRNTESCLRPVRQGMVVSLGRRQ